MSVNVNTTTNTIVVQNANQTITVVDNENANIVNVTQPLVNVIEVASPGPQGPAGPVGPQGPSGSSFVTASWAINALTASFLPLGTYNITSSWAQSASQALTSSIAISSSYALTASYAMNGGGGAAFPFTGSAIISGSLVITGSFDVGVPGANNPRITSVGTLNRGDGISVDWINRNLQDNSTITSADWEGRVLNDTSAVISVDWSNRALYDSAGRNPSADWEGRFLYDSTGNKAHSYETRDLIYPNNLSALNYGTQNRITMSGSVAITGSLTVSGSSTFTNIGPAVFSGSVSSQGGFTGSLQGTASYATQALSASFASTASFVNTLRQNVTISGSLLVSSSIVGSGSTYNTTIDLQSATISTNGTSSIAYGVKYLFDNKNVRSIVWDARQLLDNSQSLSVNYNSRTLNSGSTTVLDWSSGTGSLFGTATSATSAITASYSTKLGASLFTSSAGGLSMRSSDNTVLSAFTTFTSSLALTASLVNTTKATAPNNGLHYLALVTQSGADVSAREVRWLTNIYADPTTSTMYTGRLIATSVSASLTGSLTGALTGTASYATQALSASWAPGGGSTPTFPYTGSAIISGSLVITGSLQVGVPGESLSNTLLNYSGHSIQTTITGSAISGSILYLDTDGVWKTVNQTTNTSTKMLGICLTSTVVLLEGDVVLEASSMIKTPAYGAPLYIWEGGTVLSSDIPTTGYVRILGHCYYQNSVTTDNWIVKFRPSNDWFEI